MSETPKPPEPALPGHTRHTQFDYLLNALELAGKADEPYHAGYPRARQAVMAHVRDLEARAARLAEAERLLAEAMVEMGHASIFIRSREKMHLAGIQQYDETLAALRASREVGK